jgi:hypothetical protein
LISSPSSFLIDVVSERDIIVAPFFGKIEDPTTCHTPSFGIEDQQGKRIKAIYDMPLNTLSPSFCGGLVDAFII